MTHNCTACAKALPEGVLVCPACGEKHFICYECQNIYPAIDACKDSLGRDVCKDCFDSLYRICDDCGCVINIDDSVYINENRTVCNDCYEDSYTACGCCGDIEHNNYIHFTQDDSAWCESCFDRYCIPCSECGGYYELNDLHFNEDDEEYYCHSCYQELDIAVIKSYYFKPTTIFHYEGKHSGGHEGHFCMGLEHEVALPAGCKNRAAKDIYELDRNLEHFYLKSDTTVSGFEIVSHPRTLLSWKEHIESSLYNDVFNILRSNGGRGHNEAGIHIHTSLDLWSKESLLSLFKLFYNPSNKRYIEVIAQRGGDRLASYASLDNELNEFARENITRDKIGFKGRYTALNITDFGTLEFRIFNSSTRKDRVLKNLECVESLYHYSIIDDDMTIHGWCNFVKEVKDRYENLYNFMVEKGLIKTPILELAV